MTEINAHQRSQDGCGASQASSGRVLAIDYGARRVGVAVSDESGLSVRPLASLPRTSWKKLVRDVAGLRERFDARALVIGLPLRMDNSESEMAKEIRRIARNFNLSLGVPVFLQDEKLTSRAAAEMIHQTKETQRDEHSLAAMIILRDYLEAFTCASTGSQNS